MRVPCQVLWTLGVLALLLAADAHAQDVDPAAHKHPPGSKRSVCIIGAGTCSASRTSASA
jgi:hypothetical protein